MLCKPFHWFQCALRPVNVPPSYNYGNAYRWTHGPVDYTPRWQRRELTERHNNGHDMALPARLVDHPLFGYLFSPTPLTEEEEWVCLGIRRQLARI